MTFDPTGKTVDQILDHGAPGLSYWEQLLPVYTKAFGEPAGVNPAELYARYDEQRGLNLDEFETARTELDKALADAETRFTSHRSAANSLPSAWTGATGTEALALVNSQLRRAREDLDTIRTASAAIAAALDPIRAAILTKAERTHALLAPTPDGDARVTLDGRTPDAITALATTDPWLTATFRPEIDRQLAAFTATCTATADTVESHYRAIITAFDQVIDHSYPQPSPALLPQPDPVTSGMLHDPPPLGSSAARSVPAASESSALAQSGPGAASDPTPSDDSATPPDRAVTPTDPSATQTNPAGVQPDSTPPTPGPDTSPQAANPGPPVCADATGAPGCCASRDTSSPHQPGQEGRTCPSVTGPEASNGPTCTAPSSTTVRSGVERGASGTPPVEGGAPASEGSPGAAGPAGAVEPSAVDAPNASDSESPAAPKWVQPQAELVGQALESLFGKLETGVQQGISAVLEQLGSLSGPTSETPGDAETPAVLGASAHPDRPADPAVLADGSKSADSSPDPGRAGVPELPSGHLEFDLAGKHFVVDRAPAGDMSLAVTDESGRTHTWTLRTDHTGGLALASDNPAGQPCTPAADGPGPAIAAPDTCPPGNAPSETARPPDSPGAVGIPDAGSAPADAPGSAVPQPCPDARFGRQPGQCGPPVAESATPAVPSGGNEPLAPACPGTPEPGTGEWAPDGGDPSGCQGIGVGSGRSTICPAAPETAGPTGPPGDGEPPPGDGEPPPGGGMSPPGGDVSAGEPSVAVPPPDLGAGLGSPDVPLEIPEAGVEIPTVAPVPGAEAR